MNKFLFELGTEEIPAQMIEPALNQLESGFRKLLSESSVQARGIHLYSSPRRLALLAEDLPDTQPDQQSTIIGPPERVARGQDGELTRAGEGFARQHGIPADQLETIETDKGRYLGFQQVNPGLPLPAVLASGLGMVMAQIAWPRNMYWRESRFRFVRPIRWLVALWNAEIVDFEFEGIRSNRFSSGHRLLGAPEVELPSPDRYVELLRENFVLVDAGQYWVVEEPEHVADDRVSVDAAQGAEIGHATVGQITAAGEYVVLCYAAINDIFDPLILSFEVGSMKPDRGIFDTLSRTSGVPHEQIFFTDDVMENVEAARSAGLQAVQFTGVDQLLADFVRLGIEV